MPFVTRAVAAAAATALFISSATGEGGGVRVCQMCFEPEEENNAFS
jgi:hypothetical protein